MRDLTRTRKPLVREAAQHSQRIRKTLEDANVKPGSVVGDILGVSGRGILDALIAVRRFQTAREGLIEALRGHGDALDGAVRDVEERLGDALSPFRDSSDS